MDNIRLLALNNIELVLKACLDGDEAKKLISLFVSHRVLSTGTQCSVGEQVLDDRTSRITVNHCASICRREDFSGGPLVAELVCALASLPDTSSQHIHRLLTSWNTLLDRRNDVIVFVKDKLPSLWDKLVCIRETSSRDWLVMLMTELTKTEGENLVLLCKELENIKSNEKTEVADPLENARQNRMKDNRKWLNNSYGVLKNSHSLLVDVVRLIWPQEPRLIHPATWPSSILEKANHDGSDRSQIDEFVKSVKLKLGQQGAMPDHERELKECRGWMNENSVLIQSEKNKLAPLVTRHFPGQSELLKAWPLSILSKCKESGGVEVVEFIKSLRNALGPGAASKDTKTESNVVVAGTTTRIQRRENAAGGVVNEQPKTDAMREREWLRNCHSEIRDIRSQLTPLVHQTFPDKAAEIIKDPNWPTLYIERLLQVEDSSELAAKALPIHDCIIEAAQEKPPGQANICRSPQTSSAGFSGVGKDFSWLQRNKKMLESYSHRMMIFISDRFSHHGWYSQDKESKDRKTLMRKLMDYCEHNQTADDVLDLINFLHQISQERSKQFSEGSGRGKKLSIQDIVTVEFRVLPLMSKPFKTKAKVIDDPIPLKIWLQGRREDEVNMIRNEGCQYYSAALHITRGDTLAYRYFKDSGAEFLKKSTETTWNRFLNVPKDGSETNMVVYDYACMDGDLEIQSALHKHLPTVKNLRNFGKKEVDKITAWVRSMKSGRYLKSRKPAEICSTEPANYVEAVMKWISKVLKQRSDKVVSDNAFIGCTVAKALCANDISIDREELLSSIFCLLNTRKLDEKGYDTLVEKLTRDVFPKTESGSIEGFDQTFTGLFRNLHTTPQFLYALPLYWRIVEKARDSNTRLPEDGLENKCWLPYAVSLDYWQRKKENWKDKQKDLLKMKDKIVNLAVLHPKILKAFCYFLTSESIVEFLKHMNYAPQLEFEFLFSKLDLSSIEDTGKLSKVLKMLKEQAEKHHGDVTHPIRSINKAISNLPKSPLHKIITFYAELGCQFYKKQPDAQAEIELLKIVELICQRLELGDVDKEKVQAWDNLLNTSWPNNIGRQELFDVMRRVINEKWDGKEEECIAFYVDNVMGNGMHSDLTLAFDNTAERCFNKYLEEKRHNAESEWSWGRLLTSSNSKVRLMNFFDSYLERRLVEYPGVKFLLHWPHADGFVHAFSEDFEDFNDRTKAALISRISNFRTLLLSLIGDSATYDEFLLIVKNKNKFLLMANLLKENMDLAMIKIDQWTETMEKFDSLKQDIDKFREECLSLKNISVNVQDLQNILSTEIMPKKLCDIATHSQNKTVKYVALEPLQTEEVDALRRKGLMERNTYYKYVLEGVLEQVKNTGTQKFGSWRDVLTHIIIPTQTQVEKVARSIEAGTLQVEKIPRIFQGETADYVHQQLEQLFLFCGIDVGPMLETRKKQIILYLQHDRLLNVNTLLYETAKVLHLSGDFSTIKENWNEKELQHIQEDDKEAVKFSKDHEMILSSFLSQETFVKWLLDNTAGIQEIATLGNLALLHVRDDSELDKISNLQSAVEDFSPLIYGWETLDDGKRKASYEDLTKRCNEVVQDLKDKTEKSLKNWEEAGTYLSWVMEVVEVFGSSGKHAMDTVQEINRNGLYIIKPIPGKNLVLDDYVTLKLTDGKIHTYSSLCDLQSKIMLLAGKIEKASEVQTFVNLLTVIENLARVCIDLSKVGCLLFEDLAFTVGRRLDFEPQGGHQKNPNFTIKISLLGSERPMCGDGTMATLEEITRALRDIQSRWDKYLKKSYENHYYLNEYSVNQITYLCKELGKRTTSNSLPDQAEMLLRRVNPTFSRTDIASAIDCATRYDEHHQDDDSDVEVGRTGETNDIESRKATVRKLMIEENEDENVAKAAVEQNGADLYDCLGWIMDNTNDDEIINELSEKFDERIALASAAINVDYDLLRERTNMSLREVLRILQEKLNKDNIANSILTVYDVFAREARAVTVEGLLSLRHFGKFLTLLANGRSHAITERKLPGNMQRGVPNILISDDKDIPSAALAIYASQKNQPLPTASEVLLCTDKTAVDVVERFFRRALYSRHDNGSRIFCLAAAHRLMPKVSHMAGNLFQTLSKVEINRDYQLVIISSDRSHYLSTCFNRDVVTVTPDTSEAHLAEYLSEKLHSEPLKQANLSSVQVIYSHRSGMGKSLYVRRLRERARKQLPGEVTFTTGRFMEKMLNVEQFTRKVVTNTTGVTHRDYRLIHLDFTPAIRSGLLQFAFNLLVLGEIEDVNGDVWRKDEKQLYAVEVTDFQKSHHTSQDMEQAIQFLKLLPKVRCLSPREIIDKSPDGVRMDKVELMSEYFQRSSQYLRKFDQRPENVDKFQFTGYAKDALSEDDCIKTLLQHCSVQNPSWAQLRNFANFLNLQLKNCEDSTFCHQSELRGLKSFAVHFMILMAQDFTTPSLEMADKSERDADLQQQYELRRKWEMDAHPFFFFNDDGHSMTFIGVKTEGPNQNEVVRFANKGLIGALKRHGVLLDEDFDSLTRKEKLRILCTVMGVPVKDCVKSGKWTDVIKRIDDRGYIQLKKDGERLCVVLRGHLGILKKYQEQTGWSFGNKFEEMEKMLEGIARGSTEFALVFQPTEVPDPDPTYKITMNNALKMLAIYMRLRCNIPVVILGETGCGKTRMIKFISELRRQKPNVAKATYGNLQTLRVHGGTSIDFVQTWVHEARQLVMFSDEKNGDMREKDSRDVILFFDEANATEAIYAIKEALCDTQTQDDAEKLWIVAACNPYKKLSEAAGEKLRKSGLGYRDQESAAGSESMRSLVYRVVPIPPSMQPFLWDFGQLMNKEEESYIRLMVARHVKFSPAEREVFSNVLCAAQNFMRNQNEECKYVSLRDVERCMAAYEWFERMKADLYWSLEDMTKNKLPDYIRTLLHVLGFCYHSSLENRQKFREHICQILRDRLERFGEKDYLNELDAIQRLITTSMNVGKNISQNKALMENVYMITICADMKIPLFLIGSPGSSKSLAKFIVTKNMTRGTKRNDVFQNFKSVDMKSYQCSALTKAEEIQGVFEQCMKYQSKQDPEKHVSVVTLDEIGLAENSPHMPLKILHSLLESGSIIDDDLANKNNPTKKIGFLGISNWALDPAKMNRAIFVTRTRPDIVELIRTTLDIFSGPGETLREKVRPVVQSLIKAYLSITGPSDVEYFGLRDLYSMMKMLKQFVNSQGDLPLTFSDVMTAVIRNFSGGREQQANKHTLTEKDSGTSCVRVFEEQLKKDSLFLGSHYNYPSIHEILAANLEGNNRYLLLLTGQYFTLDLLKTATNGRMRFRVIFGSAFPGDKHHAALYRNVNRIKTCMERPCTVVVLNLEEIHESLYDALNQNYDKLGNQKYVDLGLGHSKHRVKCRVDDDFRMILIEDAETVYQRYPAPLINRLEKHHFALQKLLNPEQRDEASNLEKWSNCFCFLPSRKSYDKSDVFTGYHPSTESMLALANKTNASCKEKLLMSATMDSVVRLSLSSLVGEAGRLREIYFEEQQHDDLAQFLKVQLDMEDRDVKLFEIITYSSTLIDRDRENLAKDLPCSERNLWLLPLEQYDTLQQYSNRLDEFFHKAKIVAVENGPMILMIQCMSSHDKRTLVSCAWHCLENKIAQYQEQQCEFGEETNQWDCPGKRNALNQRNHRTSQRKLLILFLLSTDRKSYVMQEESTVSKKSRAIQYRSSADIVYIDELRSVSPIGQTYRYMQEPISKILRECLEKPMDSQSLSSSAPTLNISQLLANCLCEAIKLLDLDTPSRREQLVEILDKRIKDKTFESMLLETIVSVYQQKDDEPNVTGSSTSWILEEACQEQSLLESGTFRKTIWNHLKKEFSAILAYVISIIDANSNLDLTDNSHHWKYDVWKKLFSKIDIKWKEMKGRQRFDLESVGCNKSSFPFSLYLFSEIKARWNLLDFNKNESFLTFLRGWDVIFPVKEACEHHGKDPLRELIHDMIRIVYKSRTKNGDDVNVVEKIVLSWSLKDVSRDKPQFEEIETAILKFFRLQKYFETFSEMFEMWPELIRESESWAEQITSETYVLDKAFAFVCESITSSIGKLAEFNQWKTWIEKVSTTEKIFQSVYETGVVANETWTQICLVHLLVTQLTPNSPDPNINETCLQVVGKQAITLHHLRTKKTSDCRTKRGVDSLNVLCRVLRMCLSKLRERIIISWTDPKCPACRKPLSSPLKLTCGHYVCKCILSSDFRTCPGQDCDKTVEKDKAVSPSLTTEQENEVRDFRLKCTSFLLNFTENIRKYTTITSVDESVVGSMLQLFLPSDEDTSVTLDKTAWDLNVLSVFSMLEIAMRYAEEYTRRRIDVYLKTISARQHPDDRTVLQAIVLYLESHCSADIEISKVVNCVSSLHSDEISIEMLEWVAQFKSALQNKANAVQSVSSNEEKLGINLDDAVALFESEKNDVMKMYFLMYGCCTFGTVWLSKIRESKYAKRLLSKPLLTTMQGVDFFMLLGKTYEKELLYPTEKYDEELGKVEGIKNLCGFSTILASVSLAVRNAKRKEEISSVFAKHSTPNVSITSVLAKLVAIFGCTSAGYSRFDGRLLQLLGPAAIAVFKQDYLMNEFRAILRRSNEINLRFLPTMPQSVYFSLPPEYRIREKNFFGEMVTHMFTCPNGHMYMIDGCTRPQERYKCPECQSNIGGVKNKLEDGNAMHEEEEFSQAGYTLYRPLTQQQQLESLDERMTPHGVAVTRFLLHSCLLFATYGEKNAETIAKAEDVTADAFVSYLIEQLHKNIDDLATSLSINTEDAQLLIFKIFEHIIDTKVTFGEKKNGGIPCDWTSLESRKNWEKQFYRVYLRPFFVNYSNIIREGWKAIHAADPVTRLQRELVLLSPTSADKPWNNPVFWRIAKTPNVAHMMQFLRDSEEHGSEVLQTLLESRNLEFLYLLKPVLDFQAILLSRYQYRLGRCDADRITFSEFLQERNQMNEIECLIKKYFEAWELIREKLPLIQAPRTLNMDSFISFGLPNKNGNGKFAKIITNTLIDWQNEFLETCKRRVPLLECQKVSVSEVQESHVVQLDKKADFLGLVRMYTKYDIDHNDVDGATHNFGYNVDSLEKMVRQKYVMQKRIIEKNTIPEIRYSEDIGMSQDWETLKEHQKKTAEALPPALADAITSNIAIKRSDKLSEGVKAVSHAICFLAMTTSEPNRSLRDYMENTLKLGEERLSIIPRSVQIKHTLELYLHLTWRKAVEFAIKDVDPYRDVLLEGQEHIPESLLATLQKALSRTATEQLQKRINEILVSNKLHMRPKWRLTEDIFPNIEYLDGRESDSWYSMLPPELQFSHIVHLFRLTIEVSEGKNIVRRPPSHPTLNGLEPTPSEAIGNNRATKGNFAVVKSTEKSIGLDEEALRLFDCNVTFPERSFEFPTLVSTTAEIDSSKWPRSFISFTPTLYVRAAGLQQAASVELPSWCINDCSDEGKEATVDVLHLPKGSDEWRVITSLPLKSDPVFKFDCPDFSPVLVGVWEKFLGRHLFLVTGSIYASAYNELTLLLHLHNDLISDRLQRDMESEVHPKRRALRLNVYEAKQDDQIEFSLQIPDQGGFQLDPPGPFRFPINHNFIRCNPVMRHTVILSEAAANQVIPIRCTVSKEDEIIDGPHAFTHRWTLDPETPPPQSPTVNYVVQHIAAPQYVTAGVYASEGGHASATYQDSAIGVGEHPAAEENDEDENEDD